MCNEQSCQMSMPCKTDVPICVVMTILLKILFCKIYFSLKAKCNALYKVSTPFCEEEASLVRAAARQKHQFYGERIKPQTSHANPKLKFTKIHKGGFFPTGDLSQSCIFLFFLPKLQAEVASIHNILY